MSITAYSRTFKRELQVSQLRELFENSSQSISSEFRDFVRSDVECSSCLAKGASVVNEGKNAKGRIVKQEHFSFRDASGGDPHQKFCDHYSGQDKIKSPDNDIFIDLRKSNSPITNQIRIMVCIGIENNLFSQQDIRNMREWYLGIRTNPVRTFNISPHLVSMAKAAFYLHFKENNLNEYVVDENKSTRNIDIDSEVYKSLVLKNPQYRLKNLSNRDVRGLNPVCISTIRKKINNHIKNDNNNTSYNWQDLDEKLWDANRLANIIVKSNDILSKSLTGSKARYNNPLMALSSLLLFVSDWDLNRAIDKYNKISSIGHTNDLTAGNIIGLNPFINHSVWSAIQILDRIKRETNDTTDYQAEFDAEKERLKKAYYIL